MNELTLLGPDGAVDTAPLKPAPTLTRLVAPLRGRVAYAAAHVVPRAWGERARHRGGGRLGRDAGVPAPRLVVGLGVADAMDYRS